MSYYQQAINNRIRSNAVEAIKAHKAGDRNLICSDLKNFMRFVTWATALAGPKRKLP